MKSKRRENGATKSVAASDATEIRVPLTALAPDPDNPREMSEEARTGLGVSLETFGELGMVFNDRTGQWVSGHQRLERLRAAGAVECVRNGADGYIEHPKTGERFRVRFVDWDETKQRMANLTANNPRISGDYTETAMAQLKELEGEDGFADLGLDALEKDLAKELGTASGDDGEASAEDQSAELRENFQIVITCVDESEQSTLLQRFMDEGLKCRALI
jgi:hypothetical protein